MHKNHNSFIPFGNSAFIHNAAIYNFRHCQSLLIRTLFEVLRFERIFIGVNSRESRERNGLYLRARSLAHFFRLTDLFCPLPHHKQLIGVYCTFYESAKDLITGTLLVSVAIRVGSGRDRRESLNTRLPFGLLPNCWKSSAHKNWRVERVSRTRDFILQCIAAEGACFRTILALSPTLVEVSGTVTPLHRSDSRSKVLNRLQEPP